MARSAASIVKGRYTKQSRVPVRASSAPAVPMICAGLPDPRPKSIDLKGRTAIPGLTDTHVHLSEKGTAEMELVDCRDFYADVGSVADILQRLANAAASSPKGSWIVAHGSPMQDFRLKDKRFPDKHDLDRRGSGSSGVDFLRRAHHGRQTVSLCQRQRSLATRRDPGRRPYQTRSGKRENLPASCTSGRS